MKTFCACLLVLMPWWYLLACQYTPKPTIPIVAPPVVKPAEKIEVPTPPPAPTVPAVTPKQPVAADTSGWYQGATYASANQNNVVYLESTVTPIYLRQSYIYLLDQHHVYHRIVVVPGSFVRDTRGTVYRTDVTSLLRSLQLQRNSRASLVQIVDNRYYSNATNVRLVLSRR
jgi:hypothetical protein